MPDKELTLDEQLIQSQIRLNYSQILGSVKTLEPAEKVAFLVKHCGFDGIIASPEAN